MKWDVCNFIGINICISFHILSSFSRCIAIYYARGRKKSIHSLWWHTYQNHDDWILVFLPFIIGIGKYVAFNYLSQCNYTDVCMHKCAFHKIIYDVNAWDECEANNTRIHCVSVWRRFDNYSLTSSIVIWIKWSFNTLQSDTWYRSHHNSCIQNQDKNVASEPRGSSIQECQNHFIALQFKMYYAIGEGHSNSTNDNIENVVVGYP